MENEPLGFDSLPGKVSAIYSKLIRIEKLLINNPNLKTETEDEIFAIDQASEHTFLAKQTIYALVSNREIPFHKRKGSKRLYFSKNELTDWMKTGRRKAKTTNKR